jgi:hypothetical protein
MQTYSNGTWTDMEDAWKVFENENLKEVLETGYRFMDEKYAARGSATQKLDQAQGLIMKDTANQNNAIFMLNGDWFLNEVKANYSKNLSDISFINVPVISSLGTKLFGAGTQYGLDDATCDDLLSCICKLVDENKTIDQIIQGVKEEMNIDLASEDAQAVATARGICFARGIEHQAFITKNSTKKDIAAKVLRMMASDDFAETFVKMANAASPYVKNTSAKSQYAFVNQAKDLGANIHFRAINSRKVGLRVEVLKSDYFFPGIDNLALTLYNKAPTVSYADAAQEFYNNALTKAKADWATYQSNK